jgi:hypothetical protein
MKRWTLILSLLAVLISALIPSAATAQRYLIHTYRPRPRYHYYRYRRVYRRHRRYRYPRYHRYHRRYRRYYRVYRFYRY